MQGLQPLIIQMRRSGNAAAFTIDSFLRLELLPQICGSCFKAVYDIVQLCGIFVQPTQCVPDDIPRPVLREVIVQANRLIADALDEMFSEHDLFTFREGGQGVFQPLALVIRQHVIGNHALRFFVEMQGRKQVFGVTVSSGHLCVLLKK